MNGLVTILRTGVNVCYTLQEYIKAPVQHSPLALAPPANFSESRAASEQR